MDKILSTANYGMCVFSLEVLQDFYLDAQKEGVWIPCAQINSIDYVIKLDGSY